MMFFVDLSGCRGPVAVPVAMMLQSFSTSNSGDFLTDFVPGVHVERCRVVRVVGLRDDNVTSPSELAVRPKGFDVQVSLMR